MPIHSPMRLSKRCLYFVLFYGLLLPVLCGGSPYSFEYADSLKSGSLNKEKLKLIGTNADHYIRFEPEGMRIAFPANQPTQTAIGITPRFRVHGDFEVTLSYEILKGQIRTAAKVAPRVNIYVVFQSDNRQAATLSRGLSKEKGQHFSMHTAVNGESGKREHKARSVTAKNPNGRLRLVREGETLIYLAADGDATEFTKIGEEPCTTNDVQMIRLGAEPDNNRDGFEVRFHDLAIQCGRILVGAETASTWSTWQKWLLGGGILVLLAAGLWFGGRYWKQRDR